MSLLVQSLPAAPKVLSTNAKVVLALKEGILSGTYAVGALLPPEDELIRQLEVSRVSLREGIKQLEALGWLRIERGNGTRIVQPGFTVIENTVDFLARFEILRFEHLHQLRRLIEIESVMDVARNATPALVARLRAANQLIAKNHTIPEGYVDADVAFHDLHPRACAQPAVLAPDGRLPQVPAAQPPAVLRRPGWGAGDGSGPRAHHRLHRAPRCRGGATLDGGAPAHHPEPDPAGRGVAFMSTLSASTSAAAASWPMATMALPARAILAEGPLWSVTARRLYWVDIIRSQVHCFDPATGKDTAWQLEEHVGAVVERASGGLMLAMRRGFARFDPASGKLELVAQPESHQATARFNDGKCDPAGRFWAGTLSYDESPGVCALYRLDADGSVRVMERGVTISNGLAWDLRRGRFYYIDSPTRTIAAYRYDHATGSISEKRVAVRSTVQDGYPDGMAMDVEGKLWVAHWGGAQVVRWDPDTGAALARIRVPVSQPSACAFGGDKLDRLYITTARENMSEAQLAAEPDSGSIYVADPGVCGVPHTPFAG